MIKTNKWIVSMTLTTTIMMSSVLVLAQDPPMKARVGPVYAPTRTAGDGQEPPPPPPPPIKLQADFSGGMISGVIATEASFDTQVIMAAPFSAVAVTESVQVLADGNRIVHKSSSSISRDAQGRTRREQTVNYVTTESPNGEEHQTVWINDPIAGLSYMLNTKDRVAQKMPAAYRYMRTDVAVGGGGGRGGAMPTPAGGTLRTALPGQPAPGTVGDTVVIRDGGEMGPRKVMPAGEPGVKVPSEGVMVYSATASMVPSQINGVQVVTGKRIVPDTIQLGKQSFEGVDAEGTKTVLTIPAGQIGNEQPIVIESEAWYSADLHQVVMSRHSDPRFGESTYRLTNINRSEPDHSQFEVPSDYTVRESPKVQPMMRKKPEEQKEPQQ